MSEITLPKYIWTAKAEEKAKEKGLKPRREGEPAMYNGIFIEKFSSITKDWIKKGYIELTKA
jgi:hypothetical protein